MTFYSTHQSFPDSTIEGGGGFWGGGCSCRKLLANSPVKQKSINFRAAACDFSPPVDSAGFHLGGDPTQRRRLSNASPSLQTNPRFILTEPQKT